MRRGAAAAFLVVAVGALIGVGVVGATDERRLAFSLSVAPQAVAVQLMRGQEACQTPVAVAEDFDLVRFQVGTFGAAGVPIAVTVREGATTLASGRLEGGAYGDVAKPVVGLNRTVPEGGRVAVCIRNSGSRPMALYGGTEVARARSTVLKEGRIRPTDLTLDFLRERPRSTLAALPDVFRRATVFAPGWVGAWALWLALVAVLGLVPALLASALARAGARSPQDEPEASSR